MCIECAQLKSCVQAAVAATATTVATAAYTFRLSSFQTIHHFAKDIVVCGVRFFFFVRVLTCSSCTTVRITFPTHIFRVSIYKYVMRKVSSFCCCSLTAEDRIHCVQTARWQRDREYVNVIIDQFMKNDNNAFINI